MHNPKPVRFFFLWRAVVSCISCRDMYIMNDQCYCFIGIFLFLFMSMIVLPCTARPVGWTFEFEDR